MLALFPEGFEERETGGGLELVAYAHSDREQASRAAFGAAVAAEDVAAGWEDGWRAFHRPARIGPLWIGPPWEESDPGSLAVVIDPGRAFGTGAHPTTRLCLELLLDLEPASLLDLGCGSGVLSVAAAKLGFKPVVALDHDEVAVEVTAENARVNGVTVGRATRRVLFPTRCRRRPSPSRTSSSGRWRRSPLGCEPRRSSRPATSRPTVRRCPGGSMPGASWGGLGRRPSVRI